MYNYNMMHPLKSTTTTTALQQVYEVQNGIRMKTETDLNDQFIVTYQRRN